MKKWLLCLAFIAALPLAAAVIFEKGAVKAEIVIPADANAVEKYAAKELADHLKLIGGKDVAIVTAPGGKLQVIRLGRAAQVDVSKLAGNSALVKIDENSIDIAGVDGKGDPMNHSVSVGTLFGVYEFLERELGVRWLWPGELGTVVPKKSEVVLETSFYIVDAPKDFAVWRFSSSKQGWNDPANGAEFARNTRIWLRRHRFNTLTNKGYGHAYTSYYKLYGKSQPELFNLLPDGSRTSDPYYFNRRPDLISMCVSNPALVKLTVAEWQKRGTHTMLNVNENDTAGKCLCPNCLALDNNPDKERVARAKKRFAAGDRYWYMELGSLSDRYAAFYLAVQKEADKIDPDNRMVGCIYGNYYDAPKKVKLNKRIIMRFCPPIMYPWSDKKIAMFKDLWKGWSDAGVSLMLRPNFTHDGHNMPLMYHRQFAECFDFARDNGLDSCDYDSLTGIFGVNGITHYVIAAKNYSGKDKSVTVLENEYLSAFGKAEKPMRKWMELMIAATAKGYQTDESSVEGSSHYASFYEVAHLVFTPDVVAQGRKLLDAAEKAAAGDETALKRVQFVRAGFEDAMLVLEVQKGVIHYQKNGDPLAAADALVKLQKFRKEHEHILYCDLGLCHSREARKWPMHLAMLGGNSKELVNWQIVFDPENKGVSGNWFKNIPAGSMAVTTDDHMEKSSAYAAFTANRAKVRIPGWYFNKFQVKDVNPAQRMKLTFGAIDGNAEIYLNGELIHRRQFPHKGDGDSWKKPFDVDVTGRIRPGENLLAVRVSKDAKFGGPSGIWRSVFLSLGEVEVPDMAVNKWRIHTPMGKFTGTTKKYPMVLTCSAPAENRSNAYKGVWGRFFCNEKVVPGRMYEVKVHFRQSGDARFAMWIRSAGGGLNNNNINVAGPGENNAERTLTARFTAGSANCGIYLNLLGGTGQITVFSIKMYPVSGL